MYYKNQYQIIHGTAEQFLFLTHMIIRVLLYSQLLPKIHLINLAPSLLSQFVGFQIAGLLTNLNASGNATIACLCFVALLHQRYAQMVACMVLASYCGSRWGVYKALLFMSELTLTCVHRHNCSRLHKGCLFSFDYIFLF